MAGPAPAATNKDEATRLLAVAQKVVQFRHRLRVQVAMDHPMAGNECVGLWFTFEGDRVGTLAGVTPQSQLEHALVAMGVDIPAFIAARPYIDSVEWGWLWRDHAGDSKEVPAGQLPGGGLLESMPPMALSNLLAEAARTPPAEAAADGCTALRHYIRLRFIAGEITLAPMPLTTKLGFDIAFVNGLGVLIDGVDPDSALSAASPHPGVHEHGGAQLQAYSAGRGALITHVNGRRVDRARPKASFEELFAMRMLPHGAGEPSPVYCLTVQAPLHEDSRSPDIMANAFAVQERAWAYHRKHDPAHQAETLQALGWHTIMNVQRYEQTLKSKEGIAAYANTAPQSAWLGKVQRWCARVVVRAAIRWRQEGSDEQEFREMLQALAEVHVESLMEAIHPAPRGSEAKEKSDTMNMHIRTTYEYLRRLDAAKPRTHNLWIGLDTRQLWRKGTQCPLCDADTSNHDPNAAHPGYHVVYGCVMNVDGRRYSLADKFLVPLGIENWQRADVVLPQMAHPYYPTYVRSSAQDIHFRAVMTDQQHHAFNGAAKKLLNARHFVLDRTGECVRRVWTTTGRQFERSKAKAKKEPQQQARHVL